MSMKTWNVNDTIMYARDGVCEIKGIEEMALTREGKRKYYILIPVYDPGTKIYVPADIDTDKMRDLLTKEEVDQLIDDLGNSDIEWIDNEKLRQKTYSQMIAEGNHADLLQLISILYQKRKERQGKGKKFHTADERLLTEAERLLYQEIGYILNLTPGKVPEYIKQKVEND